jgi:SAM-dependent methyltransferase
VHCSQQVPLPIIDESVDRVGSMVGMHHLIDKLAFVRECARVLRPGGRVALSEVIVDSAVARFLNGAVHRFATNGHRGAFVRAGELCELLTAAGCVDVREERCDLHWVFPSTTEMVTFCYGLFGLSRASKEQVHDALFEYFDVQISDDGVRLPWTLVYSVGTKSR